MKSKAVPNAIDELRLKLRQKIYEFQKHRDEEKLGPFAEVLILKLKPTHSITQMHPSQDGSTVVWLLHLTEDGWRKLRLIAEREWEAFELLKEVAGNWLIFGRYIPKQVLEFDRDIRSGRFACPKKRRGRTASSTWSENLFAIELLAEVQQTLGVDLTSSRDPSPRSQGRMPSAIELVAEAFEAVNSEINPTQAQKLRPVTEETLRKLVTGSVGKRWIGEIYLKEKERLDRVWADVEKI